MGRKKDNIGDPIVSIVLPFYNRIPVTVESIKSVLGQSYKSWELLLINDGSTDDISPVQELISDRPHIRLFNQDNQGVAAARNFGIKQAKGEYIAFLDSDDLWMPHKLAIQLAYMKANNLLFSHTSYRQITSTGRRLGIIHSGLQQGRLYPDLMSGCGIATPTVILSRQIITQHPQPFPVNFHIGEDICLWIDIAAEYIVGGLDRPLTQIRIGDTSAAFSPEKQIIGLKNILFYIEQNPVYSREYKQKERLQRMIDELGNEEKQKLWKEQQQDYMTGRRLSRRIANPLRLIKKGVGIWREEGFRALMGKTTRKLVSRWRRR